MINKFKILKYKHSDIEMIDTYLKELDKKILKGNTYQLKKARLTLDYKEDYIFLQRIRKKLGNFSHRKEINYFLKKK
jgi:spore coat polysaccharide biosynthesis protein SpsF (cytidylyltransferase family)